MIDLDTFTFEFIIGDPKAVFKLMNVWMWSFVGTQQATLLWQFSRNHRKCYMNSFESASSIECSKIKASMGLNILFQDFDLRGVFPNRICSEPLGIYNFATWSSYITWDIVLSEMILNYQMTVERYPNLKGGVGGSIPGCELLSRLDKNFKSPSHCNIGNIPHLAPRGSLSMVGSTSSNSRQIAQRCILLLWDTIKSYMESIVDHRSL